MEHHVPYSPIKIHIHQWKLNKIYLPNNFYNDGDDGDDGDDDDDDDDDDFN